MPFLVTSVGDCELISIQAQPDRIANAAEMFPTAIPKDLEAARAAQPENFGETANDLRFTQNIFAVRRGGKLILIDTGIPIDSAGALLLTGLKEAGIEPKDVHYVVLTHRDLDHVGGGVQDGKAVYPNARYVIGRSEFEGFRDDESRAEQFAARIVPLVEQGRLDVIKDDGEVVPGVRLWLTPGHRDAATSVLVDGVALILADTWHSPCQVSHPEWSIRFDSNPELAATTRIAAVGRAENERLVVGSPHTPFFGLGRVVRDGVSCRWQSIAD